MKLKKAFTIAEITVALSIIAIISIFTIPTTIQSTHEAQYKTGLKKGYITLLNLSEKLAMENNMPVSFGSPESMKVQASRFIGHMMDNLKVQALYQLEPNNGKIAKHNDTANLTWWSYTDETSKSFGSGWHGLILPKNALYTDENYYWITTDDGIAFNIQKGSDCLTKFDISRKTTEEEMLKASCLKITIDTNGLTKMPNRKEPQSYSLDVSKIGKLQGDQFDLYVANDGITAGSSERNIAAYIISETN